MSTATFGLDELRRILVDRVGLPGDAIPDDPQTTFGDLGLDSLARVEVVLALQQDCDIAVSDDAAQRFVTLQDAIDCINEQLGALVG